MYFEMRLNSEYEMLVTEEEITSPGDVKPIISTDPTVPTISDANYKPAITQIKNEPEDQQVHSMASRSIGELIITQPDFIAKSIKQEMLDIAATVMEISAKHSPSCELNQFVDTHGGISGLQIEDVCSLVLADQSVFPERVPIVINRESTSKPLTASPNIGSALHMETAVIEPQVS